MTTTLLSQLGAIPVILITLTFLLMRVGEIRQFCKLRDEGQSVMRAATLCCARVSSICCRRAPITAS